MTIDDLIFHVYADQCPICCKKLHNQAKSLSDIKEVVATKLVSLGSHTVAICAVHPAPREV